MASPDLIDLLGPDGELAKRLPAYEFRPQQLEACMAVEEAFTAGKHCIIEAGTGVGKTLAYLIPAIRAIARGKRTVISTHTINLQTQLVEKDIPLAASLFPGVEVKTALMKGRSNYLCMQDLDGAEADLFKATDPLFRKLKSWARKTQTGDRADLPFVFGDWLDVAANPDTCRGGECKYYERCHYFRMRWKAADANLIVVNHALLLSDLAIRKEEPSAAILPDYHYVVLDEAHHVEEVATRVFGIEMSNRRIPHFLDRVRRTKGLDVEQSKLDSAERLNAEVLDRFQSERPEFMFHDALDQAAEGDVKAKVEALTIALRGVVEDLTKLAREEEDDEAMKDRLQGIARMGARIHEELHTLFYHQDPDYIRWGAHNAAVAAARGEETGPRGASRARRQAPHTTLYFTPVSVGKKMEELLWSAKTPVLMISATLASSGGFGYLRSRLAVPEGEGKVTELALGSPFDFKQQAMLYVPGHMPEHKLAPEHVWADAAAKEIARVVELTEGRAFLLFTSRRMLNEVYDRLAVDLPFPVFKQGEMPPGKLLEEFRASGNGVLFGLQSFWEGVDVQGEALSCVVIDRLPFAVPDSPVTRARTDAIKAAGGDWFAEYSVPQAQLRLKQGFGRLIRTKTDRGIVCILDRRLIAKAYGNEFVRHLPPASRASLWPRVERFWKGEAAETLTQSRKDAKDSKG